MSDCHLALFVAPSIYENEDIKKGILCQLFGGANKDFSDTGRGKFRSVVNKMCTQIISLSPDVEKNFVKVACFVSDVSPYSHFRSEINILLCGDPGTSKSQLLQVSSGVDV